MGDLRNKANADEYLGQHPSLRQWIHSCVGCGFRGFRPDLPTVGNGAQHLRRFFVELSLDNAGYCKQCATLVSTGGQTIAQMKCYTRHHDPHIDMAMGPGHSKPAHQEEDDRSKLWIDRDEEGFLWAWECKKCAYVEPFQRATTFDEADAFARRALEEHHARLHPN